MSSSDCDPEELEALYPLLIAYARSILGQKGWFRGRLADSYLSGKQAEDYVNEAIEIHLSHPEKFEPKRGKLLGYLKYNLVRRLIGNDSRSKENRTSVQGVLDQTMTNDDVIPYREVLEQEVEALFPDEIDYNAVMERIEEQTRGDAILETLFLGICCEEMKRREILSEFKMSAQDYDNGVRRLNTIRNNVARQFHIQRNNLS